MHLHGRFLTTGSPGKSSTPSFGEGIPVALMVKSLPAHAGDTGHMSLIPGSGRSLGGGNSNPLQYSCLGNFMDRGASQGTVHGVAKRGTWLKWLSMHAWREMPAPKGQRLTMVKPLGPATKTPTCRAKVSESDWAKVTQSCPTLCDPMDCSVCQASLSMGFSRQEYWSGLSFPSPEGLPNPGIEPGSPALQADSLPYEPPVGSWCSELNRHQNPLERLIQSLTPRTQPRISGSANPRCGLKICVSNKLPGAANATGLAGTLGGPMCRAWQAVCGFFSF